MTEGQKQQHTEGPPPTLMRQAREWLVRLRDDDISVEEITEWQTWLSVSPEHRSAYQQAERVWHIASEADLSGLERDVAAERGELFAWLRNLFRPVVLVPAFAVAAAFLAWPYMAELSAPLTEMNSTIVTARAEHRLATLLDGTEMNVGAASDVQVNFSRDDRRIILRAGEAWFDVVGDPERPFVVATPLGDITVVGTAFNVRLAGDRAVVTVEEGLVDVRRSGEAVRVGVGSSAVLSQEGVPKVVPAKPVSWRQDRLVYRAEPLRYVVADINRYSNVRIELMDERVGQLSYSGAMSPSAMADWLEGLKLVFAVEVSTGEDGTIRIRSRS